MWDSMMDSCDTADSFASRAAPSLRAFAMSISSAIRFTLPSCVAGMLSVKTKPRPLIGCGNRPLRSLDSCKTGLIGKTCPAALRYSLGSEWLGKTQCRIVFLVVKDVLQRWSTLYSTLMNTRIQPAYPVTLQFAYFTEIEDVKLLPLFCREPEERYDFWDTKTNGSVLISHNVPFDSRASLNAFSSYPHQWLYTCSRQPLGRLSYPRLRYAIIAAHFFAAIHGHGLTKGGRGQERVAR